MTDAAGDIPNINLQKIVLHVPGLHKKEFRQSFQYVECQNASFECMYGTQNKNIGI